MITPVSQYFSPTSVDSLSSSLSQALNTVISNPLLLVVLPPV